jgi:hypothetical protein
MALVRIRNLSIPHDGFATAEPQPAKTPFGHAPGDYMNGCSLPDSGTQAGPPESMAPSPNATIAAAALLVRPRSSLKWLTSPRLHGGR